MHHQMRVVILIRILPLRLGAFLFGAEEPLIIFPGLYASRAELSGVVHKKVLFTLPLVRQHLNLSHHLLLPLDFKDYLAVQVLNVEIFSGGVGCPEQILDTAPVGCSIGVHDIRCILQRGGGELVLLHQHAAVLLVMHLGD